MCATVKVRFPKLGDGCICRWGLFRWTFATAQLPLPQPLPLPRLVISANHRYKYRFTSNAKNYTKKPRGREGKTCRGQHPGTAKSGVWPRWFSLEFGRCGSSVGEGCVRLPYIQHAYVELWSTSARCVSCAVEKGAGFTSPSRRAILHLTSDTTKGAGCLPGYYSARTTTWRSFLMLVFLWFKNVIFARNCVVDGTALMTLSLQNITKNVRINAPKDSCFSPRHTVPSFEEPGILSNWFGDF